MTELEPYYKWVNYYDSDEDERSPFYGIERNEQEYVQQIYNYYISPYWDYFGSATLYCKLLYVDYDEQACIIELIGEWNDTIENDIMNLKRQVVDHLIREGIYKYILIAENVINFHASDTEYYQEWVEDIEDQGGFIILVNLPPATSSEMKSIGLQHYFFFTDYTQWRIHPPLPLVQMMEDRLFRQLR